MTVALAGGQRLTGVLFHRNRLFNTDIKAPVTFDGRVKVFGTNRARLFTSS